MVSCATFVAASAPMNVTVTLPDQAGPPVTRTSSTPMPASASSADWICAAEASHGSGAVVSAPNVIVNVPPDAFSVRTVCTSFVPGAAPCVVVAAGAVAVIAAPP